MADVLAMFRSKTKLTTDQVEDDEVVETFPIVEKQLLHLLDVEYTIETVEGEEEDTYTTGDAFVDLIAAYLLGAYFYDDNDWGRGINNQPMFEVFYQRALIHISNVYPSKVVFNPISGKYYPKDKERGVIAEDIEVE